MNKLYIFRSLVKQTGFSLIELLITVAIIGILAGIAYPSYVDHVTRSNRSEAQRELLRLANIEEQVFIDFRSYTDDMRDLGMAVDPYITESSNYSIDAALANDGQTFILTATAQYSQADDTDCAELTINEAGVKTPPACWEK
ncbi:MAG: type IV pilin protein [Colwellia sp.]|nr:type IV pilin protein [Colwellia sp.]